MTTDPKAVRCVCVRSFTIGAFRFTTNSRCPALGNSRVDRQSDPQPARNGRATSGKGQEMKVKAHAVRSGDWWSVDHGVDRDLGIWASPGGTGMLFGTSL